MMRKLLKYILKNTFLYRIYQDHISLVDKVDNIQRYLEWLHSEKSTATPHMAKFLAIKDYAREFGLRIFVETGTCRGEMVNAAKSCFEKVYSVELSSDLCQRAKARFKSDPHVHIIEGDSSHILPEILKKISEPCLFWLDAHCCPGLYEKGFSARGNKDTPVVEELDLIRRHKITGHVILIDDAGCFTGRNDYPTIDELKDITARMPVDYNLEVKDNIIRIYPKTASSL